MKRNKCWGVIIDMYTGWKFVKNGKRKWNVQKTMKRKEKNLVKKKRKIKIDCKCSSIRERKENKCMMGFII